MFYRAGSRAFALIMGGGVVFCSALFAASGELPRIQGEGFAGTPVSTAPTGALRMSEGQVATDWVPVLVEMEAEPSGTSVLPGHYAAGSMPPQAASGPGRVEIRLQQAWFDPLREPPGLSAALSGRTRGAGEQDYFLVQFHGPIRPQDRELIESAGGEILDYVPDFAFIVRMGPAVQSRLAGHTALRWSGPYMPAFRLAAELIAPALKGQPGPAMPLLARGFAGEPEKLIQAGLNEAGIEVIKFWPDSGGGAVFRLRATPSQLLDLARLRALAWIEPDRPYRLGNAVARSNILIGKDLVEQQLGYHGHGQIVAVTDSGLSTGNPATVHQDFAGRLVSWGQGDGASCSGWADNDSHGTHVAGSVLGSGIRSGAMPGNSQYSGSQAGIAPQAGLVVWAGCNDLSGIPAGNMYAGFWQLLYSVGPKLRVNNNSWGQTVPESFGSYNIVARETDRFMRDYLDMVGVFITHNSGRDANADGVADLGTVTPPGTAKNIISVGASENMRSSGGFNPGSPNCFSWGSCWPGEFPAPPIKDDLPSDHAGGMAAFSGRGPTLSNRLKPDIVAPGSNIVSARNESTGTGWGVYSADYIYNGGTSMAAPLVAGGAAIVREYFQTRFAHNPSAALVKAALLNGAYDMTPGQYGTGAYQEIWRVPDINQGWGRMDLANTLIFDGVRRPVYFEYGTGIQTGQQFEDTVELNSAGSELRVTLVWTDVHGLEASHGALVNDLDLQLVEPDGTVHNGFAGMLGVEQDRFNNYEAVRLPAAPAGSYTIRVAGFNVPYGPQPFAIALTGATLQGGRLHHDRFEQSPP